MRKRRIGMLAGVASPFLGVGIASAALTAYDSMNYPIGSFTDGTASTGTGFSGNISLKDPGNNGTTANIVAGLSYPNLPTSNNALQRPTGTAQRALDLLSTPISSTSGATPGTTFVSFLIQDGGNSGGVFNGALLNGNQANSLFVGFDAGVTGTQTGFGFANMSSGTRASGNAATGFGTNDNLFNTTTHLVVLQLLYTSPTTANITEYIDPTAGQSTAPTSGTGNPNDVTGAGGESGLIQTVNNVAIGTVSSIGYDGAGGTNLTLDEIRVGDTFGDVVGVTSSVPEPTSIGMLSLAAAGLLVRRRRQT